MPRIVSITIPQQKTEYIIKQVKEISGVLELHLHTNASIDPPGDVLTVLVTNSSFQELMRLLDKHKPGEKDGISISTSEPDSVIPSGNEYSIDRDSNEASWEEMEMIVSKDSNSTVNTLLLMFVAGGLAISGITTGSLHIVIAGMLVAPGFMPMLRVSLGLVTKYIGWRRGLTDIWKGYLALMAGALLTALVLNLTGKYPLKPDASYYQLHDTLLEYWTTVTFPSVMASAAATLAGGVLIATKRSVFTSGVMIGLALVPAAAIIPVALVKGEFAVAGMAGLRWLIDSFLVLLISLVYLLWEKNRVHKRNMQLKS